VVVERDLEGEGGEKKRKRKRKRKKEEEIKKRERRAVKQRRLAFCVWNLGWIF